MDEQYMEDVWGLMMENNYPHSFRRLFRLVRNNMVHGGLNRKDLRCALRCMEIERLVGKVQSDLLDSPNNHFLQTLSTLWNNHLSVFQLISMEAYVIFKRDITESIWEHAENVYHQLAQISNFCLVMFRNHTINNPLIKQKLTTTMLEMVAKDRRGEIIDRNSLKIVCQMLIVLDNGSRTVYESVFEQDFLDQSAVFYRSKSRELLSENNASTYISKVEKCIIEEAERARHYLDESTYTANVRVLENELIKSHMKEIVEMENSGVKHMLHHNKHKDLARMYKLLSRVESGLPTLFAAISSYVRELGTSLVAEDEGTATVAYVQMLVDLKDWCDLILDASFDGDKRFEQMMREDFQYLCNLNKKSLDCMSLFIDNKLQKGVKTIQCDVLASLNTNCLQALITAWTDYAKAMLKIRDILTYMAPQYEQQQDIKKKGLMKFRDHIMHHQLIREKLTATLLEMVAKERRGEVIDRNSFKCVCQMLMALGRSVYESVFEQPFLKQSAEFYQSKSQEFLSENDASAYVRNVENCIKAEIERARCYFDKSTETANIEVLKNELIKPHMRVVAEMENSGVIHMLHHNKHPDLASMYNLFIWVNYDIGQFIFMAHVSTYLRDLGESMVAEKEDTTAITYTKSILDLKDRFDWLGHEVFNGDWSFKQNVDGDFDYFINLNKRSPEYFALFVVNILQKGLKEMTEQEIEVVLDKCMVLFRFLQKKDVFERCYRQHLGKRLLLNKRMSDVSEKSLISKLKTECGWPFTYKLEAMFKDMTLSNTTNKEFKAHCAALGMSESVGTVDLEVRVLTSRIWPISTQPNINLPSSAHIAFDCFSRFYLGTHSRRKITLQAHLGTADVNAIFYGSAASGKDSKSDTREYTLNVSTYQMCVLMLFNKRSQWTYEDLRSETKIAEKALQRVLMPLVFWQVITKDPKMKTIEPTHVFAINDGFQSKSNKIKITSITAKGESEPERKETRRKVDDDRKYEIEVAIVRVMKARKRMQHNLLIAEVTEQLKSRFMPSPIVIKKRIEYLIDKDYLSRSQEDMETYTYVA